MSITLRRDKNSKLTIDELDDNFVSVRPYRIYVANLYQESGENPIATVLDNTIGEITWTRDDVGTYYAQLAEGTFDSSVTWINVTLSYDSTPYTIYAAVDEDTTKIRVESYSGGSNPAPQEISGWAFIEIRAYDILMPS